MIRKLFAERNGYKPTAVLIKNAITDGFRNGIINMFCRIKEVCNEGYDNCGDFSKLDESVHTEFFRFNIHTYSRNNVIINYLEEQDYAWYDLFSLLEFCYYWLYEQSRNMRLLQYFISETNRIFERENYVYRFNISGNIIEVTSDEEMATIDEALENPTDGVRVHLQTALNHLSASQRDPDYRNSIKESISAVEACCREITGESTLDRAITKLKNKGIAINPQMEGGFKNLYYYTNDKKTGIRHALMDDVNVPTSDEAIYMLVACSAFINYLTKKGITTLP